MQLFVLFLVMPVVSVIVEYKISHFFAVIQFNRRLNCELILVAMYLYFIQIYHRLGVSHAVSRNEIIFADERRPLKTPVYTVDHNTGFWASDFKGYVTEQEKQNTAMYNIVVFHIGNNSLLECFSIIFAAMQCLGQFSSLYLMTSSLKGYDQTRTK